MTDAEPVQICVVVTKGRRERRVLDFVKVAVDTLGEHAPRLAAVD